MSHIAIQVDDLSKYYRIGKLEHSTATDKSLKKLISAPFRYLSSTISPPTEQEILRALKDISFEVKHGEVVGIIGRNGAGKSTLLKILSYITEPSSGRAVLNGRVASLLEVGTGFHPDLTGRENVYLNGTILGMTRAEIIRKFEEIVNFAGVERFIDTPVKRYSSGMQVRLAFAVAAHLEAEILILDEVLAVGDAEFQKKCMGKMGDVAKGGRTVLLVSHNMASILNLCTSGIVLDKGAIKFWGETSEAVNHYLKASPTTTTGVSDLSEHPGRIKGMQSIVKSIGILSQAGDCAYRNMINTGDEVVFEIKYDTREIPINHIFIGICSPLGERICSVGTHLDPRYADSTIVGKGTVECRLPSLPLNEGEYSIMVAMGTRVTGNIDCVEDALRFHVESGDYFGTGRVLLKGQGYLAQHSVWKQV